MEGKKKEREGIPSTVHTLNATPTHPQWMAEVRSKNSVQICHKSDKNSIIGTAMLCIGKKLESVACIKNLI